MPPFDTEKVRRLEQYCAELESQLVRAQNANDALKRQIDGGSSAQAAKLDQILMALSGIKGTPSAAPSPATATQPVSVEDVIDGSAPTFLPGAIVPKDVDDTRINIQGEASKSEGFTDAADKLRRFRKKGAGG